MDDLPAPHLSLPQQPLDSPSTANLLAVGQQTLSHLSGAGGVLAPPTESGCYKPPFIPEDHGASCECLHCRRTNASTKIHINAGMQSPVPSSSLDSTETSEKIFIKPFAGPDRFPLDEASLTSNFRHSGWKDVRRKIFASLKRLSETDHRIQAFATCGNSAWVRQSNLQFKDASGTMVHRYGLSCNHCHDRLCTPCANQRSQKLRNALMAIIGEKPVTFITLTLAGKDQGLVEKVDRLYKHFKALRQHPTWSESVTGGAAFLEVKWNDKSRRWHPHLHIICRAGFIKQQDLCDAWRSITKDSFIVDIRAVRQANVTASYVTKYASKPLNMTFANDPDLLDEAVLALKGRRLCLTFGDWYGTPLTDAEDADLADDEIDAGGFSNLMPLETLLRNALDGDHGSMYILRSMNAYERFIRLANPPPAATSL